MEPTPVISYASPSLGRPKVTFRGGVVTLIAGAVLLLVSFGFIFTAWSVFAALYDPLRGNRDSFPLEALGTFVCVLAGISFIAGLITFFIGLVAVRERRPV